MPNSPVESKSEFRRVANLTAIVMDPNGQPWGPFDGVVAAAQWAAKKWPDKESTDIGKEGWTVLLLHAPD